MTGLAGDGKKIICEDNNGWRASVRVYRQRSGGVILDEDADWIEATRGLRPDYVDHPDLDPAVAGGFV